MKSLIVSLVAVSALFSACANANASEINTSEQSSWLEFFLGQSTTTTDGAGKEIIIEDPS